MPAGPLFGPMRDETELSLKGQRMTASLPDHAIPKTPDYASPVAAVIDLAGTDTQRQSWAANALCTRWGLLADAVESVWHELGEPGQELVPSLAHTMTTARGCLTVEVAGMVLGLQGEDGLTELVALTSHHDWMVRWSAYVGFELAGPPARWAVPTLIRRLRTEQAPLSTDTILRALGKIGGPEAITFLNAVIWDRTIREEYRSKAAAAIREAMGCLPDLPDVNDRG